MTDMQPENKDLYLNVYNRVFGANHTELTKEERSEAKTILYSYLYGGCIPKSIINTPFKQENKGRIFLYKYEG